MANRAAHSYRVLAARRNKLDLDRRSHWQDRESKQAHPHITKVDAQAVHVRRPGEDLYRGVQQLAWAATAVRFEVASKHVLNGSKDNLTHDQLRTQVTEGQ